MIEPELTEEFIAAAVKADRRVCVGSDRCFAFPHRREDARESCTAKGGRKSRVERQQGLARELGQLEAVA
jgi:hypothetical protein